MRDWSRWSVVKRTETDITVVAEADTAGEAAQILLTLTQMLGASASLCVMRGSREYHESTTTNPTGD